MIRYSSKTITILLAIIAVTLLTLATSDLHAKGPKGPKCPCDFDPKFWSSPSWLTCPWVEPCTFSECVFGDFGTSLSGGRDVPVLGEDLRCIASFDAELNPPSCRAFIRCFYRPGLPGGNNIIILYDEEKTGLSEKQAKSCEKDVEKISKNLGIECVFDD